MSIVKLLAPVRWVKRPNIIADIFKLDKTLISPISTDSLNQVAPRPLRGGVKTEKIEQEFFINCVDLKTSLNMIKSQLTE